MLISLLGDSLSRKVRMQSNATDASVGMGASSHLIQVTAARDTESYALIVTKDKINVYDSVLNKVIGYVNLIK